MSVDPGRNARNDSAFPFTPPRFERVVALAGGVGGAKLAAGLQAVLPPGSLTVVVNTADDVTLWGLHISPDLDTVMYTLAGMANPNTGWGIAGETWNALGMITRYGRDPWFSVGDMDFATHILRTQMLSEGRTITQATSDLSRALGISTRILPMCDEPVATMVHTPHGPLDFQEYFVRRRHSDAVTGFTFRGIEQSRPTDEVAGAIRDAGLIVFGPSNPFVSIGPILGVPGMRDAIGRSRAIKVAVSPIVGGTALKGPAADMLHSLGHEVSPAGVAALYEGVIDGMVIDLADRAIVPRIEAMGIEAYPTRTVVTDDVTRAMLATEVLEFGSRLGQRAGA